MKNIGFTWEKQGFSENRCFALGLSSGPFLDLFWDGSGLQNRGLGWSWAALGRSWVGLGGVLWGVVWSWVVLGEVLGGFWRPDRFPTGSTVEGQGLPRGVRGARGA